MSLKKLFLIALIFLSFDRAGSLENYYEMSSKRFLRILAQ